MPAMHLTDENFDQEIKNSATPVLVDFWAGWCAPCLIMAPTLDKIADEYQGKLKVAKINVDENPNKAVEYQIMSIPNMKIFKNGKVVDEIIGVVPKEELIKHIEKVL